MSKTYSEQINKARILIAGLGKNHELVKNYGISLEEVSQLEEVISEAEKLNEEVERLRSEISQTSMSANKRLIIIRFFVTGGIFIIFTLYFHYSLRPQKY